MRTLAVVIGLIAAVQSSSAQVSFDKYFQDKTLTLEYSVTGDSSTCNAKVEGWRVSGHWAGQRSMLDSMIAESDMEVCVWDSKTGKLVYDNSYSTLFCEWQIMGAPEPHETHKEAVRIPMPRRDVRVSLIRHYQSGVCDTILRTVFGGGKTQAASSKQEFPVEKLWNAKRQKRKIDILFLPDGYGEGEMDRFTESARRFVDKLFEYEPFLSNKNRFSVNALLAPSSDNVFSYNTFGIDRYIGTCNYWKVSRLAENYNADFIVVIVNDKTYGGGGIYNFYSVFAGDNPQSPQLFVHEFGHAFAALDDEYEEPGNALVPGKSSGRQCIMRVLSAPEFCPSCRKTLVNTIHRLTDDMARP